MSDLNNDLEAMLGDMVVNENEQPQEEPQQENINEPQPEMESAQPAQEVVQQGEATVETPPQSSLQQDDEISEEEMESTMLQYLSERLGREVSSFDEIQGTQNTSTEIDERVAAINEFVRTTGRDPQDWFA